MMKPSKPSVSEPKPKKNDLKENFSARKIQNYFKSAPKNFEVEDNNDHGVTSQSVYVEALKKKLRDSMASGDHSIEEIGACALVEPQESHTTKKVITRAVVHPNTDRDSESHAECLAVCSRTECVNKVIECEMWEKKYKEIKKAYLNITINYSEEHMKYKNLLKAVTHVSLSNTDDVVLSEDGIFTPNEVKALQRIAPDRPKDSTFILESLQYAYKDDISVLCRKTLKGKPEWIEVKDEGEKIRHDKKDALTPEKVERIKALFIDRISKCDIDALVHGERIRESNINKLFASGIKNIAKKQVEK